MISPDLAMTATHVFDQLTPIQSDVLGLIATPQLLNWPDRYEPESMRLGAIADGLIRRGLLREVCDIPNELELTDLGQAVGALVLIAQGDACAEEVQLRYFPKAS